MTTTVFLRNLNRIYGSIGEKALLAAQKAFIDYIAVGFAGAHDLDKEFVSSILCFAGNIPTFGKNITLDLSTAVFFNAFCAHFLELDDGHRAAMMHPGAPVFSALMGCAWQREDKTYLDFLKSATIGYECAIRIAMAIQPEHKVNGFHTTGTCGTIGAAMACSFFLDYDERQKMNTISAASTSAAGLLELIMGESQQKPYNAANASVNGLRAALIGESLNGPADALCGPRGFINDFSKNPKYDALAADGEEQIQRIYYKQYAACRHCHAPIEGALKLAKDVNLQDIDSIEVETYKHAVYGHEHTQIDSVNSAKMSIPYCVAKAFVKHDVGLGSFEGEALFDNHTIELAKKIKVVENTELSKLVPDKRSAIVRVIMRNGEVIKAHIDNPSGEPENPIPSGMMDEKFLSLLNHAGKGKKESQQMLCRLKNFPMDGKISGLVKEIFIQD